MTGRQDTAAVRHSKCGHVIALAAHPDDLRELGDGLWELDPAWELADEMPINEAIAAYRAHPCATCRPPS